MKRGLVISIVTYKRPNKLLRCLNSILNQKTLPELILVIDNDNKKSAQKICGQFNKILPLKYLVEPIRGTSVARNKAIENCSGDLIAFVDDDCILKKDWVEVAKKSMEKNKKASYIVGKSLLWNRNNIIAEAQYEKYLDWMNSQIDKKTYKLKSGVLDTKNVVIKINALKDNKVRFDLKYDVISVSGCEDVDLALQLNKLKLIGYFEPQMIVYHEEVNNFIGVIKKFYEKGKLQYLFYKKWGIFDKWVVYFDVRIYRNLVKYFPRFIKKLYWMMEDIMNLFLKKGKLSWKTKFKKIQIILIINFLNQAFSQGYFSKKDELVNKQEGVC